VERLPEGGLAVVRATNPTRVVILAAEVELDRRPAALVLPETTGT